MKRIMSVVAVLAIVGSALAFKAKGEVKDVVCLSSVPSSTATCPSGTVLNFIADPAGALTQNPCQSGFLPYKNSIINTCPAVVNYRVPAL